MHVAAQTSRNCTPAFPLQQGVSDGWQGGDAAYSMPLGSGISLWTFGDTLVGQQRAMDGKELRMVHNSMGLSRCTPAGGWSVQYLIRKDRKQRPVSLFTPKDPTHWYWAMDAVKIRGEYLVSLLCLRRPAKPHEAAFGFEACGVDLARMAAMTDLLHEPITIQPLLADTAGVASLSTMVQVQDWLYLYAVRSSDKALVVARIQSDNMDQAAQAIEFLGANDGWTHTTSVDSAKAIMAGAPSEMSIRYYAQWHRWLAVYKDPELLSDRMLLRSAPTPLGPWTAPADLFAIRRLDAGARQPGVFCYAGKDHPEFAGKGELLVTYACNAFDPAALIGHNDVYVPKAVRVQLDGALNVLSIHPAQ